MYSDAFRSLMTPIFFSCYIFSVYRILQCTQGGGKRKGRRTLISLGEIYSEVPHTIFFFFSLQSFCSL